MVVAQVNVEDQPQKPSKAWVLAHGTSQERLKVLKVMISRGATADLVPELIKSLDDSDSMVRSLSIAVLKNLGSEAESAIPALIQLLDDEDALIRRSSHAALAIIGEDTPDKIIPKLENGLGDGNAVVRAEAAKSIGRFGFKASAAIPRLVKALNDTDLEVRAYAAVAISEIDPSKVPVAVAPMIKIVEDPTSSSYARILAINAITKMGPSAKDALPSLEKVFADPEFSLLAAAAALRLDPKHVDACKTLERLGESIDPLTRAYATQALLQVRPNDLRAATTLISVLVSVPDYSEPDSVETLAARMTALGLLLAMDEEVLRRIPRVFSILGDRVRKPGPDFARYGAAILWSRIDTDSHKETIPVLIEALKTSEFDEYRRSAAISIGLLGPSAVEAIPTLKNVADKDSDKKVRQAARDALMRIGQENSSKTQSRKCEGHPSDAFNGTWLESRVV